RREACRTGTVHCGAGAYHGRTPLRGSRHPGAPVRPSGRGRQWPPRSARREERRRRMRASGRTARHAHRAAARTTALVAVLAASGLAAGAASASGAQNTETPGASLTYRCGFPSGPGQVQATVSAVLPAGAKTGEPIQPGGASLTMALPPAAVTDLAGLHSATVSAATRLAVSASEGPSGASVVWPGSTQRPAPRPAHGSLTLTTTGAAPPV